MFWAAVWSGGPRIVGAVASVSVLERGMSICSNSCCVPLGGFGRCPRFLDSSWNIRLRCSHGVRVFREAKSAVPVGNVGKLPLRGKRVGEATKLADGLGSGYA